MQVQFRTLTNDRGETVVEATHSQFPGCVAQARTKEAAEASLRRMMRAVEIVRAERATTPF